MNKDIAGIKVSALTIDRQLQDKVIIQLRTECNELKSQLRAYQQKPSSNENGLQQKPLSNENGYHGFQALIAGQQHKLNHMNDQKKRFNNSKDKLIEAILAILQNLRLECEGLKVSLLDSLKELADQSMMMVIQNQNTESNQELIQHIRNRYEFDLNSHNERNKQQQMRYQDHINSFQQKVDKLTYQLQDSEKNEINLIALNKKQLYQIEDLKTKLKKVQGVEDRCRPIVQQLSRTSTDWVMRSNNIDDNSYKKQIQDQFAQTSNGWTNSRSTSHLDQKESFKIKKSDEKQDKQFSKTKDDNYQGDLEFGRVTYPRNTNDYTYYNKLTSKYLKKAL